MPKLQTKNAMEIANKECHGNYLLISKSNIRDLQLRSWKKRRQQDYKTGRKTTRYGKTKMYFDKTSKWLKTMIVRDQENVFLFEIGLIVPAVLKCLF